MDNYVSDIERAFPHITQRLVRDWGKAAVLPYLDSLLVDSRGGRRGFPFEVLQEIMLVREVHVARSGGRVSGPWEFTV